MEGGRVQTNRPKKMVASWTSRDLFCGEGGAYHKSQADQAVTVQEKCRKTDLKKIYMVEVQGRFQGISASG